MKTIGLIPSRLESVRLPGKALLDICGIPMVIHTYKRALFSKSIDEVYICTDSDEIARVCEQYNAAYIMTSSKHSNGTERIAEAAKQFHNVQFFVDIQGDEPLINPYHIDSVVNYHKRKNFDIILPHILTDSLVNENIVKVVDSDDKVIYLTRADCPYPFSGDTVFKKHLSIISFTPSALSMYASIDKSPLEIIEGVELLRAIENDLTIGTFELQGDSFSVDVGQDYLRAITAMSNDSFFEKYSLNE
jgi:3-deoxy-manno-octulosonate cytidylyltransferase (CMP-KDO synthetase)